MKVAAMQIAEKKVSVVAYGDTPPVLEAPEHDLDLVMLAVEDLVVSQIRAAPRHGRDAGGDASLCQAGSEAIAVVATAGEQDRGVWQVRQEQGGADMVPALALGEQHQHGPALVIADGVQLGVQAALGAANAA